ncbi:MAG: UDP-N-acetylmuramate--L-alanine ligase [Alphaproteobacteria bacterium]
MNELLNRPSPFPIGVIHFIGIGGIGMSGIAEVLHSLGYRVQGSDVSDNLNVRRLQQKGIKVFIGHDAAHVENATVLVVSTAIKQDNPEFIAARQQRLPIVRRAEMLGELMRSKWSVAVGGTHGKTTTTSLVGAIVEEAGLDPTIINGGIINAYNTNARLGKGEWMVVEADESDGSFLRLPATIALVTNIDPEHMDHFGDFATLRQAFDQFVQRVPFYGFAVLCVDHPEVRGVVSRLTDRSFVTYGFSPQADYRAVDLEMNGDGSRFSVAISDSRGTSYKLENIYLPLLGSHNVQNATGAIAVAKGMGIEDHHIINALAKFRGVKRRFTRTGSYNDITVIDDYGHHPVEIAAVLKAARLYTKGKVIAVVQPHRFSRLQSLFEEFCTSMHDADVVLVADVYSAGESPIEGVDKNALVDGLRLHGHRQAFALAAPEELAPTVLQHAHAGDVVVCLGAGNITQWANSLPDDLATSAQQLAQDSKISA